MAPEQINERYEQMVVDYGETYDFRAMTVMAEDMYHMLKEVMALFTRIGDDYSKEKA